ncbi:MAG: L-asparaginase type I family protein [Candidatus Peregrinibacteria bacterium GW2011_GWA2_44_7]|nr:MAG: L-asparaginase type I family protein [Candidatus Peregrinibacteria bacterium GW2011_GWA2_44_7]
MSRPRIKILFAGGTIGMIRNRYSKALEPAQDLGSILQLIPEIQSEIKIDFERVMNLDSTNMKPSDWEILAKTIQKHYDQYDGFVIAQGTDTMAYTASALSFALQSLSKPVICTGALMPLNELGSDGRNNLIYASRVASYDLAEVAIVFGDKIIRGNRATKYKEGLFDVFKSAKFPLLGEIQRPIKLNEWRKKRRKRVPQFVPKFNNKVAVIKLFPGFQSEYLQKMIESGIATQMEEGQTNLKAYEVGYHALEAGVMEARDMTTEACVTKLMWCLAQTRDLKKIRKMMGTDYAGEITSGMGF